MKPKENPMKPLKAGIVGATGIAGQQFIVALQRHPWFRVTRVAASARSAGKTARALSSSCFWKLPAGLAVSEFVSTACLSGRVLIL